MSKLLSLALFASSAAATTTTSMWMPGLSDGDVSYEGAVINVNDDRTTLSLDVPAATMEDLMADIPATITVGGNTYYGFEAAASAYGVTVTISGECSRKNTNEASASCTMTTKGLDEAMSSVCADADYSDLCPDGADAALQTSTVLPDGYFNMIPLTITEGDDSLPSATAAASVSADSASVTASRSTMTSVASKSATATTSDSESAASSGASPTSSSAEQATGAAQMIQVPALAGLGAAVAAFFL
jgi:cell division septation protein DedD